MGFEIITYADHHFDGLRELWKDAFPSDLPRHRAETVVPAKLAFQPDLLMVAVDGLSVIGSVMAGYDGYRGWINRLAVLTSYRRQGIGRALLDEAEKRLIAKGCTKINLQVLMPNAAVAEFYRRLGYVIEDRISMGKQVECASTDWRKVEGLL